jgi:hypothetical protein
VIRTGFQSLGELFDGTLKPRGVYLSIRDIASKQLIPELVVTSKALEGEQSSHRFFLSTGFESHVNGAFQD